ncbi:MAG: DNA polymerase IV [Rhodobacteraceae bacterium]|nr:DNA polymerase IV [Paracoccaceae bacterium]
MPALCRDCLAPSETAPPRGRCPACGSPRLLAHPELFDLAIAHIDCDAFYAAVEKRDAPDLRDRPVIVGGGRRGVVSTACYLARIRGVRSAMPMFEALRRCPEAAVIRPRLAVYAEASARIRALMEALTPLVEPLALDEAFLDLAGTRRLHGAPPAVLLARLALAVEAEVGVTVSVGLAANKFLAKVASDLDKPRGFAVIGRVEAAAFLAPRPVRLIWGVGAAGQAALEAHGIRTFADLQARDPRELARAFGSLGLRLATLSRGEDGRRVNPHGPVRSISAETTFGEDTADPGLLDGHLWRLAVRVADRAKAKALAGRTVTLKLKRSDHRLLTRRATLREPTQIADRLHAAAAALLAERPDPGPFRLIGVGLGEIVPAALADATADLVDPAAARRAAAERATDRIRARFGPGAILRGRALR